MKKAYLVLFLMISTLITLIVIDQVNQVEIEEPIEAEETVVMLELPKEEVKIPSFEGKVFKPTFSINKIDDFIYNRIKDKSYKENKDVSVDDLRYLEVTYWSFNEKRTLGELIVHEKVAKEVLEIFKELYYAKYPIDKIKLVDEYQADDNLSMLDNNTSAFNYRTIAGTNKLSNHAFGLAIDINPFQNPYVKGNIVEPKGSELYVDRTIREKGMILEGDACYEAFTSRGWTWGGDWSSIKDYQHFEKKVD